MSTPYDRERDLIEEEYERGDIDRSQYIKAMSDLDREERGDAEEAAREAAERVMSDRGFF